MVLGEFEFGYLNTERGVHRLGRISHFAANKRGTSSPRRVVRNASGPSNYPADLESALIARRQGGQIEQRETRSDVHKPTDRVACQAERSQLRNREWRSKVKAKITNWSRTNARNGTAIRGKGRLAWGIRFAHSSTLPDGEDLGPRRNEQVQVVMRGSRSFIQRNYAGRRGGRPSRPITRRINRIPRGSVPLLRSDAKNRGCTAGS